MRSDSEAQRALLAEGDLHDLADLPHLETGAAAGAGAHEHAGDGHAHLERWTRRKDLDGDMGAGWRLRAAAEASSRRFALMFTLSGCYFIAEMVVGVLSGSLAVLADAFHMLTDVAALLCGYYVAQLSFRESSQTMSFGWKRAEVVGALCNACFLTAICTTIVLDAVEKLTGLRRSDGAELVANADKIIVLGCVGLAINLGGMCIFGGHGHSHGGGGHSHGGGGHSHGGGSSFVQARTPAVDAHGHGHGHGHEHEHGHAHSGHGHGHGREETAPPSGDSHGHAHGGQQRQNLNEWSMYLHVMGDAIGSAFVVGNACIVKYCTHWGEKRLLADPIASLIMCFIILIQAVPLLRTTALILMESAPADFSDTADVDALREAMEALPEVIDVHEFHLWQLDSSTFICTAHVVLQTESVVAVNSTVDKIKKILHRNNVHSSTIQTEIHSAQCSLCEQSIDGACEAPLLLHQLRTQTSACSDFVCDDGECIAKSTSIPGMGLRSPAGSSSRSSC